MCLHLKYIAIVQLPRVCVDVSNLNTTWSLVFTSLSLSLNLRVFLSLSHTLYLTHDTQGHKEN